ncbi:MAG: four-carbon acid sugar kinase family protein [Limnochordales bacterium]|nr:hypothetical protein [Bacillota bacterium]
MSAGWETYAVIADDLTGAGDTGVQFARAGLQTRALFGEWSGLEAEGADVVVISTDSRALAPEDAYGAVAAAAAKLRDAGIRPVYKKIDSTMRGPVGAEIDAVLDVFRLPLAVVCPAFPENGRVVVGGCLLVGGEPVARTALRRDPVAPVRDSSLAALLAAQSRRPVHHVGVDLLDEGAAALAERLGALLRGGEGVVVVDAVTASDLEAIVQATAAVREQVLLVGSAGLALPLARELAAGRREGRPEARARGVLVVVGSVNPVARRQMAGLLQQERARAIMLDPRVLLGDEAGRRRAAEEVRAAARATPGGVVVLTTPGEAADVEAAQRLGAERGLGPHEVALRIAESLGEAAAEALLAADFAGVVATGGDTARALLGALGAKGIDLVAEVAPGIPLGRLHGGRRPGLAVVTKAGGFGGPDALVRAAALLAEQA